MPDAVVVVRSVLSSTGDIYDCFFLQGMGIFIRLHICVHACVQLYICRECTCICVHVCALRAYVCMHVHTCTLCEYACVHVCMHICVSML